MSLRTEETFQLQAPSDRVWAYLIDPRQVVTCLPGAELTSVQDESTFLGKVKVKVGPVVAAYSGKVVITERDAANRLVRLVGEGRETGGSGSARVTITSTVAELPTGATEVHVTADLDIVGKIAQFGRGMIESVNKQMFRQFTDCVRATLETPAAAPTLETEPGASVKSEPAASSTAPSAAEPARGPLPGAAPADHTRVAPPASASAGPPQPRLAISAAEPVRLLPLIGRALRESIASFFRRLFGRGSARQTRGG